MKRKLNWVTWHLHYTPGSANNLVTELEQVTAYILDYVSPITKKETYGPSSGPSLQI